MMLVAAVTERSLAMVEYKEKSLVVIMVGSSGQMQTSSLVVTMVNDDC